MEGSSENEELRAMDDWAVEEKDLISYVDNEWNSSAGSKDDVGRGDEKSKGDNDWALKESSAAESSSSSSSSSIVNDIPTTTSDTHPSNNYHHGNVISSLHHDEHYGREMVVLHPDLPPEATEDLIFHDEFLETLVEEEKQEFYDPRRIRRRLEITNCIRVSLMLLIIGGVAILPLYFVFVRGSAPPPPTVATTKPILRPPTNVAIVAPSTIPPSESMPPQFSSPIPTPTTNYPSSFPIPTPATSTSTILVFYDVLIPNGKVSNITAKAYKDDLILSMDILSQYVLRDVTSNGTTQRRRRRRLLHGISLVLPGTIVNVVEVACLINNSFIRDTDRCEEVTSMVTLMSDNTASGSSILSIKSKYVEDLKDAIADGDLEEILSGVNPSAKLQVYYDPRAIQSSSSSVPSVQSMPTNIPSAQPTLLGEATLFTPMPSTGVLEGPPVVVSSMECTSDEFGWEDQIATVASDTNTTIMAPYGSDISCVYDGPPDFPHVTDQCNCNGSISVLPDDVVTLRGQLLAALVTHHYIDPQYKQGPESCDVVNMALMWLSSGGTRHAGDIRQRFVLGVMFFQLNGPAWTDIGDGWLSTDRNECLWFGVKCNSRNIVTGIALTSKTVVGTLSLELTKLEGLRSILIRQTQLSGTLPTELFSMPCLSEVDLSGNRLTGSLPTQIYNANRFERLSLGSNKLSGVLVSDIGRMTKLTALDLSMNDFNGPLPSQLGELKLLTYFSVSRNAFSGGLPSEISRMERLEELVLSNNLFLGNIPSVFSLLQNLRDLRLVESGLGGHLSAGITFLTTLERLEAGGNQFDGSLASEMGGMTNLKILELNDCQLSGTIPSQLGNLTSLVRLRLRNNKLVGSIPSNFAQLANLGHLSLEGNNLEGQVPIEVCALRQQALGHFVATCPAADPPSEGDLICPVPDCCTACRN